MSTWEQFEEIGTVGQLVGIDALGLIGMIVQAANTARMHKKNCRQFAQHLYLIGNLLERLKIFEMKNCQEIIEPLEQLEDALRRSYVLVNSCQDRSYLYRLAMGKNMVSQFRKAQMEIDQYLMLIPLITLVDNARIKERLEWIERDQREYTLDDEDRKLQEAILNKDPSGEAAMVLKKSIGCSYPNLPQEMALKKEVEKLRSELQKSKDARHCEVIRRLIDVTEAVARSLKEKGPDSQMKITEAQNCSSSSSHRRAEWRYGLFDCCSEPILCMKTFLCPCGTFAKISSLARNEKTTAGEACNELIAYSMILSCCCNTCCVRRKLRNLLRIKAFIRWAFGRFSDTLDVLLLRAGSRMARGGGPRNSWRICEDEDYPPFFPIHGVVAPVSVGK
ncbi:protein MID1-COMPLEMENTING ACTIVITY 1-like isoform X2 [Wolffia australiana]